VRAKEPSLPTAYSVRESGAATFGVQSLRDTAAQINVIPQAVIQAQEARGLNDVSKNDPSATPSTGVGIGTFETILLRGFELNNWSGYRRDGLMFPNQFFVSLESVERVEIVKGLTSFRYGFTNPGGIVNYVMKKPTEDPLRTVRLFGNQFGGLGVHADLGGRAGADRQFGYRINAVVDEERTFIDQVRGPRRLLSTYLDWRVTPNLLIEADLEFQERSLVQSTNVSVNSFAPGVTPFVPTSIGPRTFLGQPWGIYPSETTTMGLRARYRFNDDWSIRTAIQYTDMVRDQRAASIQAGSLQANGNFNVTTFLSPGQFRRPLVTETALEGKFSTGFIRHQVVAGIATMDHKIGSVPSLSPLLGVSNIFNPVVVPAPTLGSAPATRLGTRQRETSIFVSNTAALSEQWLVQLGVRQTTPRYESFNASTGVRTALYDRSAITPSASVVFKPTPSTSLYASYSEGLEQGGTAPITAANANQVLDPLTSKQTEVGFKADVFRGASLSAALFEIDKGLELVNSANVFAQDGRQVHRGGEIMLAGSLSPEWRLIAGAMLLDATVERAANAAIIGKRPVNVPKAQANLFLTYQPREVAGLALSGGAFYVGDRAVNNTNTVVVPSYVRLDLGAAYSTKISSVPVRFNAYLENITDKVYFSTVSFGSFQFGAPRNLRFSVTAQF
jgi:iron complex outermembrane receptor protein